MRRTVVVALGHRARHGKDTLAGMIHALFPTTSKLYSLADDLKAHCRVNLGMTKKDSPLLQREGSRIREEKGLDFWIRLVQLKIEEHEDNLAGKPHIAIVPDMRYLNEKEWVEASGGLTVKVSRLNADGTLFIDPSRPADHPSEIELEGATFNKHIVAKHGDFGALERASHEIAEILKERMGRLSKENL